MSADSRERTRMHKERRRGGWDTQNIVCPNCRSEARQDIGTPHSTQQIQP